MKQRIMTGLSEFANGVLSLLETALVLAFVVGLDLDATAGLLTDEAILIEYLHCLRNLCP